MILHLDSGAAYLVAPNTRSRIAGIFYCGDTYTKNVTPPTKIKGPIHIECKLLKHVVASATKAETADLFHNCQTAVILRYMLNTLGHP